MDFEVIDIQQEQQHRFTGTRNGFDRALEHGVEVAAISQSR